jgi:predicted nucleotidyltransferase
LEDRRLMFGLSQTIITDICTVFAQYPQIKNVLLFGSRAKNTWKDGSDIDFAVVGSDLSDRDFTKLWNQIDNLPIVFKVDCLHWDRLNNTSLKNKILKEGKEFYPLLYLTA